MDFSPISINDNGGKFEKEVDSNGVWQNGDAHAKLIVDEDWRSTESTSSDHEEEEEEAEDTETEEAYQVLVSPMCVSLPFSGFTTGFNSFCRYYIDRTGRCSCLEHGCKRVQLRFDGRR
jgi:hypothetical protein